MLPNSKADRQSVLLLKNKVAKLNIAVKINKITISLVVRW